MKYVLKVLYDTDDEQLQMLEKVYFANKMLVSRNNSNLHTTGFFMDQLIEFMKVNGELK